MSQKLYRALRLVPPTGRGTTNETARHLAINGEERVGQAWFVILAGNASKQAHRRRECTAHQKRAKARMRHEPALQLPLGGRVHSRSGKPSPQRLANIDKKARRARGQLDFPASEQTADPSRIERPHK